MNFTQIQSELERIPGHAGLYYRNLTTGECFGYHENDSFLAASVIKLPIYAVIMKLAAEGKVRLSDTICYREQDRLPPCGALYFFPGNINIEIQTLCGLMISLSDNAATNLLIRYIGLDELNRQFRAIGLSGTHLERLLFDAEAASQGKENKIVLSETGELLAQIADRRFISQQVSQEMCSLLLEQQINHKIPGYLPEGTAVAHKTGEDDGITNDVGIVYASQPFVLCFASNETDVPAAEQAIRSISLLLYQDAM